MRYVFTILFAFVCFSFSARQTVGLVLSGGGAKGIAHIGVIKALEENDIDDIINKRLDNIVSELGNRSGGRYFYGSYCGWTLCSRFYCRGNDGTFAVQRVLRLVHRTNRRETYLLFLQGKAASGYVQHCNFAGRLHKDFVYSPCQPYFSTTYEFCLYGTFFRLYSTVWR